MPGGVAGERPVKAVPYADPFNGTGDITIGCIVSAPFSSKPQILPLALSHEPH